jgi:hypothetical protein
MLATLSKVSVEKAEHIYATQSTNFRSFVRQLVRKIETGYFIPDKAMPWIRPAIHAASKACISKKPNVIWATVGPISSGVVAQQTSERTGVPYVLDFRDPWGLNYHHTDLIRPKFATRTFRTIMHQILERSWAVVFLSESVAECYLQAYPVAINEKKIHIIPNGYEGPLEEFKQPTREKCTVLYAGTLSTYLFDTIFEGLKILKETNLFYAKKLHLLFVGEETDLLMRRARSQGLNDIIEISKPVAYEEILRLYREAHAFLILGRQSDIKGHELLAGAKLFEYLKARRPIIGVLPHDETRKILRKVGISTIANVNDAAEIASVFQRVLEAWQKKRLHTLLPDEIACEKYSSERQTPALLDALAGNPPKEPYLSGSVKVPTSLIGEIQKIQNMG